MQDYVFNYSTLEKQSRILIPAQSLLEAIIKGCTIVHEQQINVIKIEVYASA